MAKASKKKKKILFHLIERSNGRLLCYVVVKKLENFDYIDCKIIVFEDGKMFLEASKFWAALIWGDFCTS